MRPCTVRPMKGVLRLFPAKAAESIDDILEKISKHGVGSLDARERAALERARTNLLKRDQR